MISSFGDGWRPRARALGVVATSLCLLCGSAGSAFAAGARFDAASPAELKSAKEKYQAGTTAFEAGKLEEALAHFRESYETVASPNSHLMVARTLNRLGRPVEAYRAYAVVVKEAEEAAATNKKYEPTAETARTERAEVEQKLGFVVAWYDGKATIAGEEVALGETIPVVPGKVTVVLESAGGEPRTEEIEVAAGQHAEVRLAPPKPPTPEAPRCPEPEPAPPAPPAGIDQATLGWVFGGVGVAGLATFGIFGALNSSKFDDLESQCPNDTCPAALRDESEAGRQYQTLANVGLGIGLVGLGTGAVLLLTAPKSTREEAAPRSTRLSFGPRHVQVSGTF